jgi:large subunit ribosomal protein L25
MAHDIPKLTAERRDRTGSRYAQRLRRQKKMPAVLYGHGLDPSHLSLDAEPIHDALEDGAHLLELSVDGATETCLIKEIQYDHLGDDIIHVDLTRVDLNEEVTVYVPLVLSGEGDAPGLKQEGALLENPTTDLEVTCLASAIPDQVIVDISALEIGDAVTVGDLTLPEGVTTDIDPVTVVAQISFVSEDEMEELEAPAEAAAEPELIGEEAEEESAEGEEGEAPAKPEEEEE